MDGLRTLLLDAYLLRAMGIAGWAPALTERPLRHAWSHRAFHIATGGGVCARTAVQPADHRR